MKAKKENKVYKIATEQERQRYLKEGFDIYDDEGHLKEYSPLKKIEYGKYAALEEENGSLRETVRRLEEENGSLRETLSGLAVKAADSDGKTAAAAGKKESTKKDPAKAGE